MRTVFGIECAGPDLEEAEVLEALGAFHRLSERNQRVMARALEKLTCDRFKLRNVDRFSCQWCGNTIPCMSFKDVVEMVRCYREVVGSSAVRLISEATGVYRQTIGFWLGDTGHGPARRGSYDMVTAVGHFVKTELEKLKPEDRERFHQMFPKAV